MEVDLEKAAFVYENTLWEEGYKDCGYAPQDVNDAFKAGAQWQKEQMMKRAANAEITKRLDGTLGVCAYLDKGSGFKFGDKVKLIIAKEESK